MPAPGKYQFAYDVDITRDLEPPDDNLLIRVRPAPFPFAGTHAGTARVRRIRPALDPAPAPPHPFRRTPPANTLQVSVLKDVGQFVGPESGSNVELKQGDECYLRRGDVEHLVRRGDLVHILQ